MSFSSTKLREIISSLYRDSEFVGLKYNVELPEHSYENLMDELRASMIPNITVGNIVNPKDFIFNKIQIPLVGEINLKKGNKLSVELIN